ncbi:aminodeoxychorismate synthase component I [Massilia sp. erpn]|uniref:aminodeoxychorismate synthase component I n=1 Tax=Massilia sp. erpn TaxID=2738142 RepID=UPI0021073A0D|nr:aminodeoxychorismate synthase component I [Massilia sp. erpn]UTY59268.1 aminodeoxychorismate synthase component I [Massilia sp. erpn]
MRCLIIDNYDSFTWNLADYVSQLFGVDPMVVRNDEYTWADLRLRGGFDAIIVSPGPGSVENDADFNISRQALEQNEIPVLGICLGLQGLAHIYGGEIVHAPTPFHGRVSIVKHAGSELFEDIPSQFEAVRYHSLMVSPESIPQSLRVIAHTEPDIVMGLEHTQYPKWGVQFHPESILSEYGKQIIINFGRLAERYAKERSQKHGKSFYSLAKDVMEEGRFIKKKKQKLLAKNFFCERNAEDIFLELFSEAKHSFWLDSQSGSSSGSRYSFMGAVDEKDVIRYHVDPNVAEQEFGQYFLGKMENELESLVIDADDVVPFDFRGGYVGFMTYEMKAVFGAPVSHRNNIPDAVWMYAKRFVVFDHVEQIVWVSAIGEEGDAGESEWIEQVSQRILDVKRCTVPRKSMHFPAVEVALNHNRKMYLDAIARCKAYIKDGESYEICLTNLFSLEAKLDPLMLYRFMREDNAAPFGAYIRSGDDYVLSTSPERFLKVDPNGRIQTKPIKGTSRRSDDPEMDKDIIWRLKSSQKERAENLMIVDLMRNDLARVSVPGSVSVPKLMDVESYKTVHQLVSTVESMLKPECSLVDLLKAVYPGGSITGAPKLRSMEIIDRLEAAPRGIYCGSIGYLGFNRVADLNIAIRSLSYDGKTTRFGAGGAITFLSTPEDEFDEVLLKAESVMRPIWHYFGDGHSQLSYKLSGSKLIIYDAEADSYSEATDKAALLDP